MPTASRLKQVPRGRSGPSHCGTRNRPQTLAPLYLGKPRPGCSQRLSGLSPCRGLPSQAQSQLRRSTHHSGLRSGLWRRSGKTCFFLGTRDQTRAPPSRSCRTHTHLPSHVSPTSARSPVQGEGMPCTAQMAPRPAEGQGADSPHSSRQSLDSPLVLQGPPRPALSCAPAGSAMARPS